MTLDETHDPSRRSWVASANGHADFPLQNLPFGVFAPRGGAFRPGVAIGDAVLDLPALGAAGLLPDDVRGALGEPSLNALFALPAARRRALRRAVFEALADAVHAPTVGAFLHPMADCELALPARVGDYTDFYAGIHHARNVGRLFRPDAPLLPNYKHVPIAYHGRASTVRPSGEPVRRPSGQLKAPDAELPVFAPTRRLDYELELGLWIGPGNERGRAVPIADAAEHIVGVTLLNDWSARDVQTWEYQPLGPFLAKSFHTTVSPWVVTLEALAPFRVPQAPRPEGDPRPLPYLWDDGDQARGAFAIELEVRLRTARMRAEGHAAVVVGRSSTQDLYWTFAQLVAHHTSNGCDLRPGDLLGSGTISGPSADACGSLLETTQGGRDALRLPTGETRTFLEDGDEVTLAARAHAADFVAIGFGPCTGWIEGAR